MRQRTVQFVNLGANRSRAAWTVMAARSPFEQGLVALLLILLAIPIFLLLLAIGAVLAAVAIAAMIYLSCRNLLRRLLNRDISGPAHARMRENVRVIRSNEHS